MSRLKGWELARLGLPIAQEDMTRQKWKQHDTCNSYCRRELLIHFVLHDAEGRVAVNRIEEKEVER